MSEMIEANTRVPSSDCNAPPSKTKTKKVYTSIFGATVDNTVYNTNYSGKLSTSETSQSVMRDLLIVVMILVFCAAVWIFYVKCFKHRRKGQTGQTPLTLSQVDRLISNKIPTSTRSAPNLKTEPHCKHTIQIE